MNESGGVALPPRVSHRDESKAHMPKNLKTALILVSVVVVFFAGMIARHWLWR